MWCVAIYVGFGVYSSIVASILAALLYAQESPALGYLSKFIYLSCTCFFISYH